MSSDGDPVGACGVRRPAGYADGGWRGHGAQDRASVPRRHTILVVGLLIATASPAMSADMASTFDDRRVACAPFRINPYAVMGIAHRTLPCGTRVELTNVATGRAVKATVVDLGPCSSGKCPLRVRLRKWDLLPPVARALGSGGLVRVVAKVLPRDP